MNKLRTILILSTCVLPFFLYAQTSPINPSRAVIGSSTSVIPTDWESQNAPLYIFKNSTTDWAGPFAQWSNGSSAFTIALANNAGAFGAIQSNDVVIRGGGSVQNIFFNLNTSGLFNTRRYRFGDYDNNKTLVIANGGKVGINTEIFPTNDPNFRLYVNGGIKAREVRVELCNGWCDYVFEKNYKLKPLSEVKDFIETNKHLPNIPSAKILEQEQGFELGKMTTLQQEKIEELFLYMIQLDEKVKKLETENTALKLEIDKIKH